MFINDKFLFISVCKSFKSWKSSNTRVGVLWKRTCANGDVKLVPIYGHSKSLKQSSVLKMPF